MIRETADTRGQIDRCVLVPRAWRQAFRHEPARSHGSSGEQDIYPGIDFQNTFHQGQRRDRLANARRVYPNQGTRGSFGARLAKAFSGPFGILFT